MTTLTVYSRNGCHRCDEMLFVLRQAQPNWGFELRVENVDSRDEWRELHGSRVPVLVADCGSQLTELCWGRMDDDAVLTWLENNAKSQ